MRKKSKSKKSSKKTDSVKRRRSGDDEFRISENFKIRLIGFLVLVFGILSIIAILSYSKADAQTLMRFSFLDMFRKETYSAIYKIIKPAWYCWSCNCKLFNRISFRLFYSYHSCYFGYNWLFTVSPNSHLKPATVSVYLLLFMTVLSASAGLIRFIAGPDIVSVSYCGASGNYLFFNFLFYFRRNRLFGIVLNRNCLLVCC